MRMPMMNPTLPFPPARAIRPLAAESDLPPPTVYAKIEAKDTFGLLEAAVSLSGDVAQLAEQAAHNRWVLGSSPSVAIGQAVGVYHPPEREM